MKTFQVTICNKSSWAELLVRAETAEDALTAALAEAEGYTIEEAEMLAGGEADLSFEECLEALTYTAGLDDVEELDEQEFEGDIFVLKGGGNG